MYATAILSSRFCAEQNMTSVTWNVTLGNNMSKREDLRSFKEKKYISLKIQMILVCLIFYLFICWVCYSSLSFSIQENQKLGIINQQPTSKNHCSSLIVHVVCPECFCSPGGIPPRVVALLLDKAVLYYCFPFHLGLN